MQVNASFNYAYASNILGISYTNVKEQRWKFQYEIPKVELFEKSRKVYATTKQPPFCSLSCVHNDLQRKPPAQMACLGSMCVKSMCLLYLVFSQLVFVRICFLFHFRFSSSVLFVRPKCFLNNNRHGSTAIRFLWVTFKNIIH